MNERQFPQLPVASSASALGPHMASVLDAMKPLSAFSLPKTTFPNVTTAGLLGPQLTAILDAYKPIFALPKVTYPALTTAGLLGPQLKTILDAHKQPPIFALPKTIFPNLTTAGLLGPQLTAILDAYRTPAAVRVVRSAEAIVGGGVEQPTPDQAIARTEEFRVGLLEYQYLVLDWYSSLPLRARLQIEDAVFALITAVDWALNTLHPTRAGTIVVHAMAVLVPLIVLLSAAINASGRDS